jgi:hypothetical protein
LPADYNAAQAVADGLCVDLGVRYNEIVLDNFYRAVLVGNPAFMRYMSHTIEGDPIITEYQFDGNIFTVTNDNTRDRYGVRTITTEFYKYLVYFDGSSVVEDYPYDYFLLSNQENITTKTEDGTGMTRIEGLDLMWIPSPSDDIKEERGYNVGRFAL